MPSANTRITRITAKPSSSVIPLILESCSDMPRPRVTVSVLERVSALPTIRAPPRSQPLPASRQSTQAARSASERAAALDRLRARSIQNAAARACLASSIEERCAARRERIRQANLRLKEIRQQGK